MATIKPIALGMMVEELYCLLSEHLIYLAVDQDEWSRAVQRKIAQLYVAAAPGKFDDEVPKALQALSQDVPKLSCAADQVAARSELAAVVDYVIGALAAPHEGADRAAYDTGVFVRRISLCAKATAATHGPWWRPKRELERTVFQIYRAELLRTAEALRCSVDLSRLDRALAESVKALLVLALSGKRFSETHEMAEQIMENADFSSRGSLAPKSSIKNPE